MKATVLAAAALLAALPSSAAVTARGYYLGEWIANLDGGIATGSEYLDDAGLIVQADLERLYGVPGGRLSGYVLWNNGSTFSNGKSGDLQVVSNVDAPEALRLYEFWYEQAFGDDATLRVGLYDLNSEFDHVTTAQLFVNSSHGIGADFGQSGRNGPSIFPVTSLAARVAWQAGRRTQLRYAILDGVPGDPSDPSATSVRLGNGDGALHAAELDHETEGGMRLGAGGWLYSASFDVIGGGRRDDGNHGVYGFIDLPLRTGTTGAVDAFLRYGIADDRYNVFGAYLGAGIVATGVVPGRPGDRLGLAVASARAGDAFRGANPGDGRHETAFELTYDFRISKRFRVQPDLQYVVNPGLDPDRPDALVVGLRFELRMGSGW